MVQQRLTQGNPSRDYFPTKDTGWTERSFVELPPDARFNTTSPFCHEREKTIEAALKDCARIPVKEFALVAILDSGEERFYSSQSLTPYQQKIFTDRFKQDFRRSLKRANTDGHYPNSAYSYDGMFDAADIESGYEHHKPSSSGDSSSGRSRRHPHRQSRSEDSDEDESASAKRKRPRGSIYSKYSDSNDNTPVPVQKTQQLKIGDSAEVEKFYFCRFKDMQQSSCKVMGKAFVKLVEPKKQTHHPYTKGDIKAPPWWPNTTGENSVRHKEPDHLLKPERIRLLVHILRMVVEPSHQQHPAAQKLGLNVKKLEEVTMEVMSNWFNDKEHPENAAKRPYLREIFKIAKAEERYKNGEIDATTYFPVMHGERSAQDGSDDEVDDGVKDEDDDRLVSVSTTMSQTESPVSQPSMQSRSMHSQPDFRDRPLAVRYNTQPQIDEHSSYSDSNFSRNSSISFQSPGSVDPIRRSFASPGFQSPQQNMYGWQTNLTTGPTSSDYYGSTPTMSSLVQSTTTYQLPPPNAQQPSMLPPPIGQHHYDGLSNARQYDTSTVVGNQLRTGSLGHPHHMNHGFPEYLQDGSGYAPVEGLKDGSHLQAQ